MNPLAHHAFLCFFSHGSASFYIGLPALRGPREAASSSFRDVSNREHEHPAAHVDLERYVAVASPVEEV